MLKQPAAAALLITCVVGLMAQTATADQIHTMTKLGKIELVKMLLEDDPRCWDTGEEYFDDTPPGIAVELGRLDILKEFVRCGYDPNPRNWRRHPIRQLSPYYGTDTPAHMEMLQWLLDQGVEPSDDLAYHLIDFVENNHVEGARMLLEHGVNPNTAAPDNHSALDLAESPEMTALLKQYGAQSQLLKAGLFLAALAVLAVTTFIVISRRLAQSRSRAVVMTGALGMLFGAGAMFLAGGTILREMGGADNLILSLVVGIILFKAVPIVIAMRAAELAKRAHQLGAVSAEAALPRFKEPPILYLRSFQNDESYRKKPWWHWLAMWFAPWMSMMPKSSHEEQLVAKLTKVGPVVAIGDPDEELPKLGAYRMYVGHDQWKQAVADLMERSQLVVLRIGLTEGILWELQRCVDLIDPQKLVIWIVPGRGEKVDQPELLANHLHTHAATIFPQPISLDVCRKPFIYFDEGWQATGVDTLEDVLKVRPTEAPSNNA